MDINSWPRRPSARQAQFRMALVVVPLVLAACVRAHATIETGSVTGGTAQKAGGKFIKLSPPLKNPKGPPNSVGDYNFRTPNLYGFDENQNITLASPLAVDVRKDMLSGPVSVGTVVASHYIFFDPLSHTIIGKVTFDSDVLAIITSTKKLAESDFLAKTGVNYLSPTKRGLEPYQGDSVAITGTREITVRLTAGGPGDYVRVLTARSPGAAKLAITQPGGQMDSATGGLRPLATIGNELSGRETTRVSLTTRWHWIAYLSGLFTIALVGLALLVRRRKSRAKDGTGRTSPIIEARRTKG